MIAVFFALRLARKAAQRRAAAAEVAAATAQKHLESIQRWATPEELTAAERALKSAQAAVAELREQADANAHAVREHSERQIREASPTKAAGNCDDGQERTAAIIEQQCQGPSSAEDESLQSRLPPFPCIMRGKSGGSDLPWRRDLESARRRSEAQGKRVEALRSLVRSQASEQAEMMRECRVMGAQVGLIRDGMAALASAGTSFAELELRQRQDVLLRAIDGDADAARELRVRQDARALPNPKR